MNIGEAINHYAEILLSCNSRMEAHEANILSLQGQVERLEKDLTIAKARFAVFAEPRPAEPSVSSQMRSAVGSGLKRDIDRVAALVKNLPAVKASESDTSLDGVDLNAEVPEGSTVIMSGEADNEAPAGPSYNLKSIVAQTLPLPPSMVCMTRAFCAEKVENPDYGGTCPKVITKCPFNRAHY